MGHHSEGMEGLLQEDHHRINRRHHCLDYLKLPATASLTLNLELRTWNFMICLIIEDKFYTDKLIIKFKGKKFKAQSSKEKKFKGK